MVAGSLEVIENAVEKSVETSPSRGPISGSSPGVRRDAVDGPRMPHRHLVDVVPVARPHGECVCALGQPAEALAQRVVGELVAAVGERGGVERAVEVKPASVEKRTWRTCRS